MQSDYVLLRGGGDCFFSGGASPLHPQEQVTKSKKGLSIAILQVTEYHKLKIPTPDCSKISPQKKSIFLDKGDFGIVT